jgi:ribosomal protein S1
MTKNNTNFTKEKLITYSDFVDDVFGGFKNDKERIKYMKNSPYAKMNLAKSFGVFYGIEVSNESKQNSSINRIVKVELGQIYNGQVKEFTKQNIVFDIPGVKEELICKENFNGCEDAIQNYLLTHDNKLLFEVREKKDNKYYVSVISAYYKTWTNTINKAIQNEDGIEVHIDDLVKGGYVCHANIYHLTQLTGRNYTHSVFIPGSHIVLNIERDFEKWIGQNVVIVPQKFVEFRKDIRTGETEMSLVGSRKRVLQIFGMQNMYDIYQTYLLSQKEDAKVTLEPFEGTVTGIINSNNKTGIFVELDGKYITGLAPISSTDLLDYRPGDKINVKIKEFEVQEGKEPFILNKKNKLVKCNVRPVFEIV